jgi:hypothetical protein
MPGIQKMQEARNGKEESWRTQRMEVESKIESKITTRDTQRLNRQVRQ